MSKRTRARPPIDGCKLHHRPFLTFENGPWRERGVPRKYLSRPIVGRSSHRNERSPKIERRIFFFSCCQKEKMLRFKWRQQQQKAPRDEPTVNDGSSSVNQKLAVTNFFFADMWQQKKKKSFNACWR